MYAVAGGIVPSYPALEVVDATRRADDLVATATPSTLDDLSGRLATSVDWLDEETSAELAHDVVALYWLLAPVESAADLEVDPVALHRALVLTLSRPADDPCWQEYQQVLTAIETLWRESVSTLHPLRRPVLPNRARVARQEAAASVGSHARAVAEAKRRFRERWGGGQG